MEVGEVFLGTGVRGSPPSYCRICDQRTQGSIFAQVCRRRCSVSNLNENSPFAQRMSVGHVVEYCVY
jgi:hypothetical protein